ncbi:MAG: 3-deoxy-7-phosphoheptulonate synthase class II [Acidobacteriota bacterium]|nr:3-deoxy-7-phosphoheptulonate synthase class II [Acidobacteriota bacterium]
MSNAVDNWKPTSWQSADVRQQPTYADQDALQAAAGRLAALPPLVTSWEVETLKGQLASAARGERFVLQGGDCAESFAECTSDAITAKLKILLQMSLVLTHSLKKRVIRVGRFAGQYAKPRSSDTETRGGETLPSYRGDLVNSLGFDAGAREPDPLNLLRGYHRSALTLNFIRGLIDGGFADLHHPEYWNLDFVGHSQNAAEYQRRVESIADSLKFMETLAGVEVGQIERVDFYASHEALHLVYEQAQTRLRTAFPGSAHIEYARGIRNPLGVKVGTGMDPADVADLVEMLNPDGEEGRLALIHRCGAENVARELPPIIEAVSATGRPVLWICDPMHGNTKSTSDGMKTRDFNAILSELEQAFDLHAAHGTILGGVHFELTGEDVTECTGGARGLDERGLRRAYRSQVDPRLNYEQALEMALLVARKGAQAS